MTNSKKISDYNVIMINLDGLRRDKAINSDFLIFIVTKLHIYEYISFPAFYRTLNLKNLTSIKHFRGLLGFYNA